MTTNDSAAVRYMTDIVLCVCVLCVFRWARQDEAEG